MDGFIIFMVFLHAFGFLSKLVYLFIGKYPRIQIYPFIGDLIDLIMYGGIIIWGLKLIV